ncbi:Sec-independent protein translocase subunit TatA [Corynebacterium urinipleomorphum]|uniref:Sec-independent protein translocase subunit TatA n=1 Tax=Corynebacterium urinipleomorphum TaxID=1852380 RepID=UPI000B3607FA|nr:Sec-independent protein translocase subunit TatA [Corynebacterium urinipleomorphum]
MPNLGPMEILLIVFVILLLFGASKLPDLARSVGRSARIFKSEVNEMQNDGKPQDQTAANVTEQNPTQTASPQREITSGPANTQAQQSVEQGFWNQPQNQQQQPNQPGTNPNA